MANLRTTFLALICSAMTIAAQAQDLPSVAEGLALLASDDLSLQTEGRMIVQRHVAQATTPETREAAAQALVDFAQAPAPESAQEIEFEPGLQGWIDALNQAVVESLRAGGRLGASSAARREAVVWAGQLGTEATVPALAALLGSDVVWREALNGLMALPGGPKAVLERLNTEPSADRQVEYVRAFGQFRIRETVDPLGVVGKTSLNRALAFFAVASLSQMGIPPVAVFPLPADATADERAQYAFAGLRAAQALLEQGETKKAIGLFRQYSDSSGMGYQIRAAMTGLNAAGSDEGARTALGYLTSPQLRTTAQRVLIASHAKGTDEMIEKAFAVGDPSMKAALLEVFQQRGGATADQKLHEALQSDSAEIRFVAANLLGQTPNETDLLEQATKGSPATRAKALAAFLDAANARLISGDHAAAAAQFRIVLQQRLGADAERTALEGLGQCGEYEDNDVIADFLGDPATGAAAYAAKARLALKRDDRNAVIKELETIAEVSPYEEGVFAAADGLAKLGLPNDVYAKREGFLAEWTAIGPFPNDNDKAYGLSYVSEERAEAIQLATWLGQRYQWERIATPGAPPIVDPRALYTDAKSGVAYLFSKFNVARPTAAELWLGVGGSFELWVNGTYVAGDREAHLWRKDEIRLPVTLNAGTNRVLIKLIQRPDDWRLSTRVVDRRGKPIDLAAQRSAKDGSEGVGVTAGRAAEAVQKSAP